MEVISLHKSTTSKLIDLYSKQKYGDREALRHFAKELYKLMLTKSLISDHAVLYVGVKYPYSDLYKKNFVILTEIISDLSGLPMVYAFYQYEYDPAKFYDNHKYRKAAIPELSKHDKQKFKGFNFLVIEDCVVTGTTKKAIEKSLYGVCSDSTLVTIFDFTGVNVVEKDLNNYFFEKYRIEGLKKLFKQSNYIPTTQMLRTIGVLSKDDLRKLLRSVPRVGELINSYKSYTGRELIQD